MTLKKIFRYLMFRAKAKSKMGFGIHSPFVFDFATNVLDENHKYYAYIQIKKMAKNKREYKEFKLIYRMLVYYKIKHVFLFDKNREIENLIKLSNKDTLISCCDSLPQDKFFDLIFVENIQNIADLPQLKDSGSIIVFYKVDNQKSDKYLHSFNKNTNFGFLLNIFVMKIFFARTDVTKQSISINF